MSKEKNPIEQELAKMDLQWEEFVQSQKPIFRWQLPPDALQFGNTFVRVREQTEDDNNLFLALNASLAKPKDFAAALAAELDSKIQQSVDELQAAAAEDKTADKPPTWPSTNLQQYSNGFAALFGVCQKLLNTFQGIDLLVLAIMPTTASSTKNYRAWWEQCCENQANQAAWPEQLRLLVFDNAADPLLPELTEHYPKQIFTAIAPLNMQAALEKILAAAEDSSPGAALRKQITRLNHAIGKQDRAAIEKAATKAIQIAEHMQSIDMLATVHVILAAGYLNLQDFAKAVATYRTAQTFALQGVERGLPGCDKLLLQAAVCEGTALFGAEQYAEAAVAYQKAAELATQQQDKLMTLEAWRMSSYCYEQVKQNRTAWENGIKATQVGEAMTPEERQNSTLPFLGDALLRIAPDSQETQRIQQTFDSLLGKGWLEQLRQELAQC